MLKKEVKYIIVRDKINNRLRHFKSDWLHHYSIAKDNGYSSSDILEAGLLLEGRLYILEGIYLKHIEKRAEKFIGNRLNFYQDLRLTEWLRGRELESSLYYSKKPAGILPEGD